MKITNSVEFGQIIRETRVSQRLTQANLAIASNCGQRFIVDLERGKETCELEKAIYVAKMLGLKIEISVPARFGI
jgi:transcriptional regulator with XRE-family HTH domain